jgi:predicted CXXCH cytochrome family protein
MVHGDPYTAGDDLGQYTTPISAHSVLEGVDLAKRFWRDGTPRLTAYEYQGLLMSVDYQRGDLTCISCHNAHGGDPRGMIDEEMRGPKACLQCHGALEADVPAHTKHLAGSSGSDCYACHMPKIVYGVLDVHPTHRIQKPDPARAWRFDMPEACTVCHTNRTARWAAEEAHRLWGGELPEDVPAGDSAAIAESLRALLGGDAVRRAVAVTALASERTYAPAARERLWVLPFLVLTMEDNYAAVRHFAYRGLRAVVARADLGDGALDAAPPFDPQAPVRDRARAIAWWRAWWSALDKRELVHPGEAVPLGADFELDAARVEALLRARVDEDISIGE